MNIDFDRNTFNYRFKTERKRQNRATEALKTILGVCVLLLSYFSFSGLIWAVEKFIN